MEVDLGLGAGLIGLGHAPQLQGPAGLGQDLRAALADVITHRRIRQPLCPILIDQPGQHPPRGMALLLRGIQIAAQHLINRGRVRLSVAPPATRTSAGRHR